MIIQLVGDPHGDINFMDYCLYRAKNSGAEKVVMLGDVGFFWPGFNEEFEKALSRLANQYNIDVYGIDGNHDNHDKLPHDADDFVELFDRVFYIPRGFSWTWGEKKFLAMGGAWSIDKADRVPGVSWWSGEEPTLGQIKRAERVGKVDYVLAHDAPMWAQVPYYFHISEAASRTRKLLTRLWQSSQCDVWFHGHHHVDYKDFMDGRKVQGLDCNMRPSDAWTLLEV